MAHSFGRASASVCFFFQAEDGIRDLTVTGVQTCALPIYGGIRPDAKRNREFLEQFSLDTLKMVGTLRLGGQMYGLVQTKDGLVHRVSAGNHLGQAEGKITDITPAKIILIEVVPDSLGGENERPPAPAPHEEKGRTGSMHAHA